MNPAWSVVLFTTWIGIAQGLVVGLTLGAWRGTAWALELHRPVVGLALALSVAGLAASFFHLGRPERAWRAVLMWRTSWLSREVIVMPAFIAALALWWWIGGGQPSTFPIGLVVVALALVLWWCTAMIYACIRFIEEWAQAATPAMFILSGAASGLTVLVAMLALFGYGAAHGLWIAFSATLAAWLVRCWMFANNKRLVPRSNLSSATGIPGARLTQTSMGMSAGAFNTREFFHGRSALLIGRIRWWLHGFGYLGPLVALGVGLMLKEPRWAILACALQLPGLVADRWMFFAQARHPQNLYYQKVS